MKLKNTYDQATFQQMEMLFCSTVVGLPFSIPPMLLTGELFTAWNSCSQRWLPLFYVLSLVALPLVVKDIPTASGLKICCILVVGWLASPSIAGYTTFTGRKIVKTEMVAAEPMTKPSPFSSVEVGRYENPEECPFFPDDLPSPLAPLDHAQVLYLKAASININKTIWNMYINELLPLFTAEGDDGNYASMAT